jgi:hypothetical protein
MSAFFDTTSDKEYNLCNLCQADVKKYRNDEWNMQMHINSKHPDAKEVEDNESDYNDPQRPQNDLDSKDGSDENDSIESSGENTDAETDESDENDSNESDGRKSSDAETDVSDESDSDDKKRYLSDSDSEGSKHLPSLKKLKRCKHLWGQFESCLNNPEFLKLFAKYYDPKPVEVKILNSDIVINN